MDDRIVTDIHAITKPTFGIADLLYILRSFKV
jgi:hypothetical protein